MPVTLDLHQGPGALPGRDAVQPGQSQGHLVMEGTGGLRKLRQPDPRRGKGKRGGLKVIYYWWPGGDQYWLFTVYDKDQADDLTAQQRKLLRQMLHCELAHRQPATR